MPIITVRTGLESPEINALKPSLPARGAMAVFSIPMPWKSIPNPRRMEPMCCTVFFFMNMCIAAPRKMMAGANVLMPNLSPASVRNKYLLYDNKLCTGEEAAQCIECLKSRIAVTGFKIVTERGDYNGKI